MNAMILAQLLAKGFENCVGPCGGEGPVIKPGLDCAYLCLTSQGPTTIYQINEDGSVRSILNREDWYFFKYDCGMEDDEIEEMFEHPKEWINVIDLIEDQEDTTWFLYFEYDNPLLYSIIKQYVALMEAEKNENSED